MTSLIGFIGVHAAGNIVKGPCGDVLLFSTPDDARAAGAVTVLNVVWAILPRKKKQPAPPDA